MAAERGPMRFIVLAATGEDVRQCTACECCYVDDGLLAQFDLSISELLKAVLEDDEAALTSRTIWALAEVLPDEVRCLNRLNLVAVARALCREAELRGLISDNGGGGPELGAS